ncbi:hypothetical protein ACU8KH_03741 [Lachancea thermotolerans]
MWARDYSFEYRSEPIIEKAPLYEGLSRSQHFHQMFTSGFCGCTLDICFLIPSIAVLTLSPVIKSFRVFFVKVPNCPFLGLLRLCNERRISIYMFPYPYSERKFRPELKLILRRSMQ